MGRITLVFDADGETRRRVVPLPGDFETFAGRVR